MGTTRLETIDCLVVGAGVVGLAIARRLAMAGRDVLVVDRADAIGTETSSRNSEVVHAGIHYPPGSLKARTSVEGNRFLWRYCAERSIPHDRCGKLIVATAPHQIDTLHSIRGNASANGVTDLEIWSAECARTLEPELECVGALWSPSTGIVDSHALMLAYLADAEAHGAVLVLRTAVESARPEADSIVVRLAAPEPIHLRANIVVNSAGLGAPDLARRMGVSASFVPRQHLCKGNYYVLSGRSPFRRLVYPVPEPGGLGVHVTIDLAGQCRFGPDVEWIEAIEYSVDPARAAGFRAEIRKYWPAMPEGALHPGYAGIRPKLAPRGAPASDFQIAGPETHGISGLVNLFGIASPGLTASTALAIEVGRRLNLA
jgi:L-2-hydroxyglutarate oxidase LhgO